MNDGHCMSSSRGGRCTYCSRVTRTGASPTNPPTHAPAATTTQAASSVTDSVCTRAPSPFGSIATTRSCSRHSAPCELACACPRANCSTTVTDRPRAARRHAAAEPITPDPTTTTSVRVTSRCAARHPGPLAATHELRGHLAAGLVDHLVAEHHRAAALALGRRLLVRLEEVEGVVEL